MASLCNLGSRTAVILCCNPSPLRGSSPHVGSRHQASSVLTMAVLHTSSHSSV